MDLKEYIGIVENFPIEGISFKNITGLLKDKDAYHHAVDRIIDNLKDKRVDYILGPEARGFLMGAAVAYGMNVGFIPARKKGKLPGEVELYEYDLEYGKAAIEIQKNSFEKGARIAIVDDLLATGGTVKACAELAEKMGAEVVAMEFLIELTDLGGRKLNSKYPINAILTYDK